MAGEARADPYAATMPRRLLTSCALALVLVTVAACADTPPRDVGESTVEPAPGFAVEANVVVGLDRPTQMIAGPDGRLWVAQLAGPEGAGQGQVVAVGRDDGTIEVLVEGLDKPTGLAFAAGALWIQQPRSLLRAVVEQPTTAPAIAATEVVVDDLPNNGRSQGTLTVTADGVLVYATSGARDGDQPAAGSGALWELDPAAPRAIRPLARGLKNGYARVELDDGAMAVTDVLEPLPGVTPEDELNVLRRPGGDFGWPTCVGNREPVADLGATPRTCRDTLAPIALLGAGATPTSVVVAPWDPSLLVVARWNSRDVVGVPLAGGAPRTLLRLSGRPQHLLVDDDGILVSDHAEGVVHRLSPDG